MPLILLLVLLVLFSPLAIDIYLPAIPQMAEQLGAEVTLMQGTITWFLFSMGLGQLLVGPLADRYGRKPIALGGVLLYGLSALAAGFAASLGELMLARVLQGFGACATSVAAFSVVRDSYGPKKSGQMISYLNGAICFIPALAPLLGGWLTAKAGWSANFWFMAGYAVVVGSWLLWRMPETRPEETSSSGPLISWSRYSPVLRSPSFLFNAALCMLAMAVILAYVTAAPVQLMVKLGLDMNGFSYWFTANAALNILACFLAPRFIARVGPRRTLRIGLLVLLGMLGTLLGMLLTLRCINANEGQRPDHMVAVRFFISDRLVVSTRRRPVQARCGTRCASGATSRSRWKRPACASTTSPASS